MKKAQPVEIVIMVSILLILALGVILSYQSPFFFRNVFVVEDGPIEWLTVVALILALGVCCFRLKVLIGTRPPLFLSMLGLLALFCLFGAGEEISWGQRIFNFDSPEIFKKYNSQQELGLHNLKFGDFKINKVIFSKTLTVLFLVYLGVMTPLYRKGEGAKKMIDKFAIPMPHNHHIMAYLVCAFIVYVLVDSSKKGELMEFAGSYVFLLNIVFAYNKDIYRPYKRLDQIHP